MSLQHTAIAWLIRPCAEVQLGNKAGVSAFQRGRYPRALHELGPASDNDTRAESPLADICGRGFGVKARSQQAGLRLGRGERLHCGFEW